MSGITHLVDAHLRVSWDDDYGEWLVEVSIDGRRPYRTHRSTLEAAMAVSTRNIDSAARMALAVAPITPREIPS